METRLKDISGTELEMSTLFNKVNNLSVRFSERTHLGTNGVHKYFIVIRHNEDIFLDRVKTIKKLIEINENGMSNDKAQYMLLGRLKSDAEYFLNAGYGAEKHLWAGSVKEQISEMKKIWHSLPNDGKPEWLSMEDILSYEQRMYEVMKKNEPVFDNLNDSFEASTSTKTNKRRNR